MTVRYAVTFEFDHRPPLTHRGVATGGKPATLVARATRDAHKALRPVNWSSMVVALLERLTDEADAAADDALDDEPTGGAAEPAQES